jgi:D-alanyl-D-alanine carboxypeptidase
MKQLKMIIPKNVTLAIFLVFFTGAVVTYVEFRSTQTLFRESELKTELAETKTDTVKTRRELTSLKEILSGLGQTLSNEQSKNISLASKFESVASTVGTLEKLSKTDRELLKKYSKVYFLSENYIPLQLSLIDPIYTLNGEKKFEFHSNAYPFLANMIQVAHANGIEIRVVSAYRSFGTQSALKSAYKVTYGAGTANQFSADQGYSEHQLGTTVDLTTPEIGTTAVSFEKTLAYTWLLGNAHKYGFVLSYPKGNSYYQYEPWHWRFVGIALATRLHNEGKYFYDLEQRAIDEYLVGIFDLP